jgi:hypothetical protein
MPVNSRLSGIHAQITASTAEATRFATPMMPVERLGQVMGPSAGISVTSSRLSGSDPVTGA